MLSASVRVTDLLIVDALEVDCLRRLDVAPSQRRGLKDSPRRGYGHNVLFGAGDEEALQAGALEGAVGLAGGVEVGHSVRQACKLGRIKGNSLLRCKS